MAWFLVMQEMKDNEDLSEKEIFMGLFSKVGIFKNRLTKFNDDEPLTKLALAIVLILDIFILSVVFGGLAAHTDQLTSPLEYFPYNCRNMLIDNNWSEVNKIDNLQDLVLSDYNNYSYRHDSAFEKSKLEIMHPECRKIYESINGIYNDPKLKKLFIKRQGRIKKKNQLIQRHGKDKGVYDSLLLGNIAEQNGDSLDTVSSNIKESAKNIEKMSLAISEINKQLDETEKVNKLWSLIQIGNAEFRQKMVDDLNRYELVYLFKELLWQLLFMLPLFAIFCFWHDKSIKKNNNIQTLISSHLIIIALIPIVFKVIHVVLELIPFHFFKELFKILELLHIIALWHYIVIFIAIGVTIFTVFFIQKKLFNKKKLYEKRLMKGECYFCGKVLPGKVSICPFCGTNQYEKCKKCDADTFVAGEHCIKCGETSKGNNSERASELDSKN